MDQLVIDQSDDEPIFNGYKSYMDDIDKYYSTEIQQDTKPANQENNLISHKRESDNSLYKKRHTLADKNDQSDKETADIWNDREDINKWWSNASFRNYMLQIIEDD